MAMQDESASWLKTHLRSISLAELFDGRIVGFSSMLAWYFVVFFSKTIHYSTRNNITSHFNSVFGWSCAGILLGMMLAMFAAKILGRLSTHSVLRHAPTLCMSGATISLVCVENYLFTQPWCSISAFVAGAGFALAVLDWTKYYAGLSIETSIVMAAASLILSALLFGIITSIPLHAGIVATVLLPIASDIVLTSQCKAWQASTDDNAQHPENLHLYARPVACLALISFFASFVQILFLQPETVIESNSYSWVLLVAALVSTALVGTALFSQDTLAYNTAFRRLSYALSFIFLLLPILDLGSTAASILALTIFCLLVGTMWPLVLRVAQQMSFSTNLLLGVALSAQTIGALLGTFGGSMLSTHTQLTPRLLSVIALVAVMSLMLCVHLLLSSPQFSQMTGIKEARIATKRSFKERVFLVAESYALTERETEILELVVKGRSKPRIQEMLGLSSGTVNTHLANIYRKLDLHDKQDILDLVERMN